MDCKLEPAARTLVRIECISVQGFIKGFLASVLSVLFIPLIPFVVMCGRWRVASMKMGIAMRLLLCPWWFLVGVAMAIATPFLRLWVMMKDVFAVGVVEWKNRWTASSPKLPDGQPFPIEDEEDKAILDAAVTMSVLRDYNEEAKRFGQGIDIQPIG